MKRFKVGDRVKSVNGFGTIKEIAKSKPNILVYHDDWNGGHDGNLSSKKVYQGRHCWFFNEDELELIGETKIITPSSFTTTGMLDVDELYRREVLGIWKKGNPMIKKERNEMNWINEIDRYIVNNKAVIIFWKDGNKTIAKVDEKDEFDKEIGFMIAFNKGLNFYHSNRKISKTELKKIYECISNDKFKQYLFLLFNRFTFQDTIKSKKYLEGLEVKK